MKTRPFPSPLLFAFACLLLLPSLTAIAQGPDDGPLPPPPAGQDGPPPAPPMDLTQMPLDVTPPPLNQKAQPSPTPQPTAAARPTPAAAQSPANGYGRGRDGNGRRTRRNNEAAATPAQAAQPVLPVATPADVASPTPGGTPLATASPAPAGTPLAATSSPAPAAPGTGGIRFNFQNASLLEVLNYLSASAGFIITQEVPVTGTVNVVSQQTISADEAVDLLNTILAEKGYVALRSGRILKIISLQGAAARDLPVNVGSNPPDIPRKDNMVTQILPVRYAEVGKLVDNLRGLLSPNATISSNDSSNAIILTDTQTNIHRMAEIIHALDTSISGISQIKVFTLRFSDSKGLADVLTQLFSPQQKNNQQQNPFANVPPQFQRFLQQQGAGAGAGASPQSEARQAAARVVAVADETSNSVIVSAPDEVMPTVAEIVSRLDTSTSDITETQIFRLLHADATELATVLTGLYADTGTTSNTGNNNRNGQGQQNRGGQPQQNNNTAGRSERSLLQSRVVAVADARTNSVLVSASHDTMAQIGVTIGRLDASDSKKQHVYVYTLSHADPDNVATILRGMYSVSGTGSASTATQPSTSALATRSLNGASSDITNSLNTGSTNRTGTTGR